MNALQIRRNFSRNTLFRMVLLASAIAALIVWKIDSVNDIYFRNQLTPTGLIINSAIITLFFLGVLRMIFIFSLYHREERALQRFSDNLDEGIAPMTNVATKSIIARRFHVMEALHKSNTPINHNALASTLVASESTRNSFPKFINNILILTGVFGTIVSLAIALVGASDLLGSAVNVGGMGQVIHGMSTALSTTITAIVCYFCFGYFYMKLTDVQTNLISGVEQVTARFLLPRFQVQTDSVLYEFTSVVRSLQQLIGQMADTQSMFEEVERRIIDSLETYQARVTTLADDMHEIKDVLKRGFRLPEEP